jgi:hypothetical protein
VTYFHVFLAFPKSHGLEYACFPSAALATFAENTMDAIHSLLWRTYWPSSHIGVSQGVPHFEKNFNIVSVRYMSELLRDTSYIKYKHKTERLHLLLKKNIYLGFVDNRINKPNGLRIKL